VALAEFPLDRRHVRDGRRTGPAIGGWSRSLARLLVGMWQVDARWRSSWARPKRSDQQIGRGVAANLLVERE
jgi:hypothetical protein